MSVRPYAECDFAAVAAIYGQARRDELAFEAEPVAVRPLADDATILAAFRESTVLVFDDGAVRGFAATHGGQLRALFVDGEARGRGVGAALLDAVRCAQAGPVTLYVATSNGPARAFYAAHGGVDTGELTRPYAGRDIAYTAVQLPLCAAPI